MAIRRGPSGQGPHRSGSRSSGPGASAGPSGSGATRRYGRLGSGSGRPTRTSEASRGRPRRPAAPRAPKAISGRAAALGLLLLALTLAYAYPVRVYLAQQAQIDQLQASQAAQRNRISDLKAQIARWDDPNYIIMQARTRLQLVRKGELLYVVQADPVPTGSATAPSDGSWLSQLWSNVQGADHPDGP